VLAKGQFLVTQQGVAVMRRQGLGGDVVNIVSKNALFAGPNNIAYGTAKAAQLHMSRLMAAELGKDKIRVNVVNPDAVIEDSFIWKGGWAEGRARAYGITVEELPGILRQAHPAQRGDPARRHCQRRVCLRGRPLQQEHRQHPQRGRRRGGGFRAVGPERPAGPFCGLFVIVFFEEALSLLIYFMNASKVNIR
jgi:NAD(P)-dependent dehydrogenase (short-subunit alcohol dehydrogenase family)